MLNSSESTIIDSGIAGASITSYVFTVPSVSGHGGNDHGRVRGRVSPTSPWVQINRVNTSNGVNMTGNIPAGKYSQLEFYYYTDHTCMYNKANITYNVGYHFE